MSRIRSIHPGIWTDEAFMSLSAHARLLLIGLWTEAYDDGVFEWKPLTLKAKLFPVDAVDVSALLLDLVEAGVIARIDGHPRQPGAIRNFQKYQRPKKPNSSGMLPDEWRDYVGASSTEPVSDDDGSEPVPHPFPTSTGKSPQMEDGGGKEEEEKNISLDAEREFEDWYSAYPRHVGKGAARKAYRGARRKTSVDALLDGAKRASEQYRGKDEQFIPHPSSWLNAERWLDQQQPKKSWRDDPEMRGVL